MREYREYVCIDGPLAGQTVASSDAHTPGELVVIEVVDIAQDEWDLPRFEYRVEPTGAGPDEPVMLRFAS